ncbi:MAG: hypothetical protein KIS66_16645 [Fimbriimonadaceae bacterium]|nr:hypothetical protein [Fimbriimonadaceae bacterium]
MLTVGFLGGNGADRATDVAVRSNGEIAVVGTTTSASGFPLFQPIQNQVPTGVTSGFLAVLRANVPANVTLFGGGATIAEPRCAFDSYDQVHIVGRANSGLTTSRDAAQPTFGGATDGFYLRFGFQAAVGSPALAPRFAYSTYFGGTADDRFTDVLPVTNGLVYAIGDTNGRVPVTSDADNRTNAGAVDGLFVALRPVVLDDPVTVPATLDAGESAVGHAGISGPLPYDVVVQLASGSSRLTVPPTVTIPAGRTQAPFLVASRDVLSSETVTLSAFWDGLLRTVSVPIAAPGFGGVLDLDGASGNYRPTLADLEFREVGLPNNLVTKRVTIDAQGRFQTDAPSNRAFDVSVKIENWLRRTTTFDTRNGPITNASLALLNGDCNGDNSVNVADFLLLRRAFGSSVGQSEYRSTTDLTRDGSVNVADFLALRRNFGRTGDD